MSKLTPQNAYELLLPSEQEAVDNYVQFVEAEQRRRGERIAFALDRHIPADMVKRSRGLLEKPIVRAAINEKLMKLANTQDVNTHRLVKEHACLAFSNIADFINFNGLGETFIELSMATREQLAAVKSIETVETPNGRKVKLTLYDKQPSLNALATMMGLLNTDNPPALAEPVRAAPVKPMAHGADAEKAYSELLEQMRT